MSQGPPSLEPGNPRVGITPPAYNTDPRVTAVNANSDRIAGGTSVTITGYNFRNNPDGTLPTVKFGTLTAGSVVVVDANTITCVTPAASVAALVDVSVTINGQTGTLSRAFTYYTSQITAVTPGFGVFTGGTNVVITGYNFVAGSSITFGGSAATGVTFVDDGHYLCVTPNHADGFVDVVIQEPGGSTTTLKHGFKFTLLTTGNDIRRTPGIVIRDVLNNQANTASFKVDGRSSPPTIGQKIEITDEMDSSRLLFRGTVAQVEQVYEEITTQLAWNITAVDFTFLLNKYRPVGKYVNQSVTSIVKDLVAKFAPGFTSTHVQTNLTKVSANFDGTMDFSTCFNQMAQAIGGGHWYVDYDQDVHFFHKISADIIIPDLPQSVIHLGPGSAMVAAESGGIPTTDTFPVGFYMFRSTFLYDNGMESALSPFSNIVALQGTNKISLSSIPIGAAAGTHTVVGRRIYYRMWGPGTFTDLDKFVQINDNVLTSFTTYFKSKGASSSLVVDIADTESVPVASFVAPPSAGPAATAQQGSATVYIPQSPPFNNAEATTYTPASWAFKVSFIYRDGTESLPSPATNAIVADGSHSILLTGIPLGPTINSVDVIGRKIYGASGTVTQNQKTFQQVLAELNASKAKGTLVADFGGIIGTSDAGVLQTMSSIPTSMTALAAIIGGGDLDALMTSSTVIGAPDWSPDKVRMWYLINDNTTTSADIGPGMGDGVPQTSSSQTDIPLWPNPDGPSLEDGTPPDTIDDTNVTMLKDPPFTSSVDLSQVRNRIYVRGAGTSTIVAAGVGTRSVSVMELGVLSRNGGTLISGSQKLSYTSLEAPSGPGFIKLRTPLTQALDAGAPINLFYQADDRASQQMLAKMELDRNGKPTDGIHEYTIVDTSLSTPFQLYMRAFAELEVFGRPLATIKYATRDPKTASGKTVTVNLTNPPIAGTFLIQDVQIDQVHDESDAITPRYTVTASSSKFDLSDLLLSLMGQKIGDGTSLSGVTSTTQVTTSGQGWDSANERFFAWFAQGGLALVSSSGIGCNPTNGTVAPVANTTDVTSFLNLTGTGSGFSIGAGSAVCMYPNGTYIFIVRTGATLFDIASCRIWAGLGVTGNPLPPNADVWPNTNLIAFRYSTTGSETGWCGYMQRNGTGAGSATTPTIAPILPNTDYVLKIAISQSGNQVDWSVNGGTPQTVIGGAFFPDDNTTMTPGMGMNIPSGSTARTPMKCKAMIGRHN